MIKKRSGEGMIQKLMVLYIILWSVSPPLQVDMIYRLLALGCAGIWVMAAMRRGFYVEKIHIYAVFFMIAVIVIAYMEKGNFDAILKQIAIYILVVCFLMNCFYRDKWEELHGLIPVILLLLIIFNWKTGNALLEDHTLARKLVRADEATYGLLRQGIGGYSLIYPQVCVFPAVMMWIKRNLGKNLMGFFLGCVWFVTYVRCIMNAGYSIAIFTSIASLLILLFYKGKDAFKAMAIAIVVFVIMLASIIYLDVFREFLLVQFDGTAVATKIHDLVDTINNGAAEGSIYDRIVAYRGSLEVIGRYPLLGGLWRASGGGHSAILDAFAKYGIPGGYVYVMMIFYVPFYYKKIKGYEDMWNLSNAVTTSIMFVAMLDSFNYSFMAMILLFLPLLYEDIKKLGEMS